MDRVTALHASRVWGTYTVPESAEAAAWLRQRLVRHAALARELAGLRAQAQREVQVSRRVELNLAVKRIEAEMGGVPPSPF